MEFLTPKRGEACAVEELKETREATDHQDDAMTGIK